jgi:hypothetical protein
MTELQGVSFRLHDRRAGPIRKPLEHSPASVRPLTRHAPVAPTQGRRLHLDPPPSLRQTSACRLASHRIAARGRSRPRASACPLRPAVKGRSGTTSVAPPARGCVRSVLVAIERRGRALWTIVRRLALTKSCCGGDPAIAGVPIAARRRPSTRVRRPPRQVVGKPAIVAR